MAIIMNFKIKNVFFPADRFKSEMSLKTVFEKPIFKDF